MSVKDNIPALSNETIKILSDTLQNEMFLNHLLKEWYNDGVKHGIAAMRASAIEIARKNCRYQLACKNSDASKNIAELIKEADVK